MAAGKSTYVLELRLEGDALQLLKSMGPVAERAFAQASRAQTRNERQWARWGAAATHNIGRVARRLGGLARSLASRAFRSPFGLGALGVIAGAAGIQASTRAYIDFQTAVAEVRTISSATTEDFAALERQILDTAKALGGRETDVAKAAYQTLSAGITDAADASEFLARSAELATAGLSTNAEAVDLLSSAYNAFGIPIKEVGRTADVFFETVRRGKTTIPELAASFASAAPLAATLGVKLEEVLAAVAALTLGGTPTAEAFTQVNAVMVGLLKHLPQVDKLFRENLGRGFDAATLSAHGFAQTLQDVVTATGGSEEKLLKLFGRVEGAKATLSLTGNQAKAFAEVLVGLGDAGGAVARSLEDLESFAGVRVARAFNRLRIEFNELGRSVVSAFDDMLSKQGGVEKLERTFHILLTTIGATIEQVISRLGTAVEQFDDFVRRIGASSLEEGIRDTAAFLAESADVLVTAFKTVGRLIVETVRVLLGSINDIRDLIPGGGPSPRSQAADRYHSINAGLSKSLASRERLLAQVASAPDDLSRRLQQSRLAGIDQEIAMQREQLELARMDWINLGGATESSADRISKALGDLVVQFGQARTALGKVTQDESGGGNGLLIPLKDIKAEADAAASVIAGLAEKAAGGVTDAFAQYAAGTQRVRDITQAALSPGLSLIAQTAGKFGEIAKSGGDLLAAQAAANNAYLEASIPLRQQLNLSLEDQLALNEDIFRYEQSQLLAAIEGNDALARRKGDLLQLLREIRDEQAQQIVEAHDKSTTKPFADLNRELETLGPRMEQGLVDPVADFIQQTKTAGEAFQAFAQLVLRELARIIAQAAIAAVLTGGSSILAGFGIGAAESAVESNAKGGIMAGTIKSYASGGIARQPTLALMGDHDRARFKGEAFVPLPDGRRIPVDMRGVQGMGDDGMGMGVTVNMPIQAADSRSFDQMLTSHRRTIVSIVASAIAQQSTLQHQIRHAAQGR